MVGLLSKDQKQIPIGTSYQVEVPAWTDNALVIFYSSNDLKWLGTPIWHLQIYYRGPQFEQVTIGKGRQEPQDNCRCNYSGSVECVRFQVAEKRFPLKCELGSTFYAWQFDRMGEEVAHRWTEEARKFKTIVRSNPLSLNRNFRDQLQLSFSFKGRQNLGYFFNCLFSLGEVYKTRVTTNNIDSDDEETEVGFLSKLFGQDATKIRAPGPVFCAQNA